MSDWMSCVPFLGMIASGPDGIPRPFITRVIEQSLPGILVAALGVYVSDVKQTEQIVSINAIIKELRQELREMRRDLYKPTNYERNTRHEIPP